MRKHARLLVVFLPLLLLLLPAPARAIGPGGDLYLGYSRLAGNTFNPNTHGLNGWEAAGHFKFMPFVGVEADVAHYGAGASSTIPHTTTVLFGPRLTVGAGIHVFVHGLVGVEHSNDAGNVFSSNALTVAAGGGLDIPIFPFFAWRINADYIQAPTRSYSSPHDRIGTGLVFRF